ncbi:hypothetical protein [Thiocapsa bogorovii]|uniref:hypothetical protein n=1 Tax=Thiocapsa bogorovii TaxID=521689 RepID=UPI001E62F9F8|nr:hypothetical protein [Thiocapsa bogorovii]UHD16086.1 hypothetical protein LT988_23025 [Thiocapsa bogorovii]
MIHRHLNHQGFTLAAIDDLISRGRWRDWAELRQAVLADRALLDKVERVCRPETGRSPWQDGWLNAQRSS